MAARRGALNLESASNVLSRRPPKDYEAVIPESPMGNVLGFQFRHDDRERDGDRSGELRFFHCNGVGRELLMRLGELCAVDGRPGPHVLLMSATSWAGTSSRYHVHADVGAVLRPHDEEVEAVLGSEFRKEFLYWPGNDRPKPLRLSGCDPEERPQALLHMLHQLAVPDRSLPDAESMLDTELKEIDDPDRRRILLLVGSYDEARRAAEYLNQIPEWNGRVTRLVSDDADSDTVWTRLPEDAAARTLPRGDVKAFPSVGGDILVAPLLAVERGHNIVLRDGKAAIGTVYFLARPHPRPDDISLAIQSINDWAVRQLRDADGSFRQNALAAVTPRPGGRGVPQPRTPSVEPLPHPTIGLVQPAGRGEGSVHLGPARRHVAGHRSSGARRRAGPGGLRRRGLLSQRSRIPGHGHPRHQPAGEHA